MKKLLGCLFFLVLCLWFAMPQRNRYSEADCQGTDKRIRIVYEDKHLVVVNKNAGILSIPLKGSRQKSMQDLLRIKSFCAVNGDKSNYFHVHRLDRNTSGLMIFAKNGMSWLYMKYLFFTRKVNKKYRTVVEGVLPKDDDIIKKRIVRDTTSGRGVLKMRITDGKSGQRAITKYHVLKRFANATYVDIRLLSWRTHQIRLHFSSIGHPVFSDALYGATFSGEIQKHHLLQAYYLKFKKPFSNEVLEIEIPPSFKIYRAINFAEKQGKE